MFLISAPKGFFEIIIFLIGFACIMLPILSIIDILRRDSIKGRIVWLLIIILLPIIGSIAYFYNRENLDRR